MSNVQLMGWDGKTFGVGNRVEIHPATDYWMMGARYGEVIGTSLTPDDRVKVKMDKLPDRVLAGSEDSFRRID